MRGLWLVGLVAWTGCKDADQDGVAAWRDCDDENPRVFVGGPEVCDGLDNNCDGHVDEGVSMVAYQDRDGDGAGDASRARRVCVLPADGVEVAGDCDDLDASVHPAAAEVCNVRDDNCDGAADEGVLLTFYADEDGDGHGVASPTVQACLVPPGFARVADDCDDANPAAWTGAAELCDGEDNDCDDEVDEGAADVLAWVDADGDGYGDPSLPAGACGPVPGLSDDPTDCDDADAARHPGAGDPPNGTDDDCDGFVDELAVPGDAATVADALLLADPGQVIQLGAGVFVESVDLRGHDVTLAGEGCDRTWLYGDGGSTVKMDQGALAYLSVLGGTGTGGIWVTGSSEASHVCVASNQSSSFGGGINLDEGVFTLSDAWVADNYAAYDGGGVDVAPRAELVATRVQLVANRAGHHGGAASLRSGSASFSATVFAGNVAEQEGGGAVNLQRDPAKPRAALTLSSVSFVGNDAPHDRLFPEQDTAHGSAIYTTSGGDVSAVNVVFAYQGSPGESPFFAEEGAIVSVEAMAYAGNGEPDTRTRYDGFAVRGDPDFLHFDPAGDPKDWDLRIGPHSVLRDAGAVGSFDPDGSRSDIGAYGGPDAGPDWDGAQDLDHDGLPDAWELANNLQIWRDDADEDPDADGLTNANEWAAGTDVWAADTDGDGVSDGDEISEASDPTRRADHRPQVGILAPTHTVPGERVELDASVSYDLDGDTLDYAWVLSSRPPASVTILAGARTATVAFTPDQPGIYRLTLTVSDAMTPVSQSVTVNALDAVRVPDDAADLPAALAALGARQAVALRPGAWQGQIDLANRNLSVIGLGAGATIDADGAGSVVSVVGGGSLLLANLTLTGGDTTLGGGLICTGCDGTDGSIPGCALGPVIPSVTLEKVTVRGNVAASGGGVFARDCDLTVRDSLIEANRAVLGGGLYARRTTASLVGTDVVANVGSLRGGGVVVENGEQLFRMTNGAIAENEAPDGAAVWFDGSMLGPWMGVFENLAIVGNSDGGDGAAFLAYSGRARLFSSVISSNQTARSIEVTRNSSLDALYDDLWSNTGVAWDPPDAEPAVVYAVDPAWVRWSANAEGRDDIWSIPPHVALVDLGYPDRLDRDGTRADVGPGGGPDASPLARLDGLDLDLDGMPDGWEWRYDLDLTLDDAGEDPDADGRDNLEEWAAGTDPRVADGP